MNIDYIHKAKSPIYSAWVSASAGTGKTKILTDRVLNLLLEGIHPESILCLTFTKAARGEMLSRINSSLYRWSKLTIKELNLELSEIFGEKASNDKINRAQKLYSNYIISNKKIRIYTIHAFCQNLLQRFPIEADIKASFTVIDEITSKSIINRIISSKEFILNIPETLKQVTSIFSIFDLLTESCLNLQKEFYDQEILDSDELEAGFSKIFSIKIEKNFYSKQINLLKKELNLLLSSDLNLEKNIKTIASARDFIDSKNDDFEKLVKIFITTEGSPRKKLASNYDIINYPTLETTLNKIQDFVVKAEQDINAYRIATKSITLYKTSLEILSLYKKTKDKHNYLDYEDLISIAYNLLSKSEMKEWVKYKLDNSIDHILVDESQDTSEKQWKIIKSLTNDFFSGNSANSEKLRSIFAVGDVKQSIYSFQGARPDLFNHTKEQVKQECIDAKKDFLDIDLKTTYRLPSTIYEFVSNIFKDNQNIEELPELTCYRNEDYNSVEVWPIENIQNTPNIFWPTPDKLFTIETPELNLAKKIAKYIRRDLDSKTYICSKKRLVEPQDFMILVQKRSSINSCLNDELLKLNIPVAGLDRLILNKHLAIKDLIAIAKFTINQHDDLNLASILKSPYIGLSDDDILEFSGKKNWFQLCKDNKKSTYDKLNNFLDRANNSHASEFFISVIYSFGILTFYKSKRLYDYVDAIKAFMTEINNITKIYGELPLSLFIEMFENEVIEIKRDLASSKGVKIMTIHGSKGLESPIVILADSNQLYGSSGAKIYNFDSGEVKLPIYLTSDNQKIIKKIKEEEKKSSYEEYIRLLYVATTRAQDKLIIAGVQGARNNLSKSWYDICSLAASKYFKLTEDDVYIDESGKINTYSETPHSESKNYKFELTQNTNLANIEKIKKQNFKYFQDNSNIGSFLHLILENLSNNNLISNVDFKKLISKFPKIIQDELIQIYKNIHGNEYLKFLFNHKHRSEVEVGFQDKNGNVTIKRLDLLVQLPDSILIVDYKSDQRITDIHNEQLYSYIDSVKKIFPDQRIEAKIFWLKHNIWQDIL